MSKVYYLLVCVDCIEQAFDDYLMLLRTPRRTHFRFCFYYRIVDESDLLDTILERIECFI